MKIKTYTVLIIYILACPLVFSQNKEILIHYKNSITKQSDSTKILSINRHTDLPKITDSIKSELINQGYLNMLISKPQKPLKTKKTIIITLNHKYTHIKSILQIKNKRDSLIMNSLSRKREQITAIKEQRQFIKEYNEQLKKAGYPFSEVKYADIKIGTNDTILANLDIKITQKRYIDHIVLKGYSKFPKALITAFTNKKRIYNSNTIKELDEIIKTIPYAKQIKSSEVLFKKDSTHIYMYLKKIKTNTAQGLIGFNNKANGKLELNGYIDLKLQNNLNRAETFTLQYRNDNGEQSNLQTSINLPYIWKTPVGINTTLNIQRRDSTYQRTSFTTGLFYKPNWKSNIGLNYTSTTSTATVTAANLESYIKNGVELTSSYQKNATDPLMPENLFIQANIGITRRDGLQISEKQINLNTTFIKLWHLSQKSKFLTHISSYYLNSKNIQFNELYQFGGLRSIRGFNQNSIDSSFFTTLATDYRYRLNEQIYLHTILDIGIFENFNNKTLNNLYSFGGGIAILTSAGILNISVANGRFKESKVNITNTIAHINLRIKF